MKFHGENPPVLTDVLLKVSFFCNRSFSTLRVILSQSLPRRGRGEGGLYSSLFYLIEKKVFEVEIFFFRIKITLF